jgi:NAD(P)H-hydrate epimerase
MAAEYMTLPLPEGEEQTVSPDAVDVVLGCAADVIAVGPGLGIGTGPRAFMRALVERAGVPLVIDADGLNAFADDPGRLRGRDDLDIVITPHPGEMARLAGLTVDEVQRDRIGVARAFATSHQVHVVLKGHRTLVVGPTGSVAINLTGNPGMATGGSGDVLTGVIAAWFGQLLDAEAACTVGVYLHGAAGDLSEADEGEHAMIAGDLIAHLGDAVLELTARRKVRPGASATDR